MDGVVNMFDLSAVAGVYGQSGFASNPYDKRNEFDENGDGVINIFDLSIVAGVYGRAVPPC